MPLVAQRINDLITKKRKPFCDSCIADRIKLTTRDYTAIITGALGTTGDFDRDLGRCSICKGVRTVIKANRTEP